MGDLSPDIDDKALYNAFSPFGSISDARVMMDPAKPGYSRGYGFVAFRKKDDAQRALSDMNGENLGSRAIRCNWANQKSSGSSSSSAASSVEGHSHVREINRIDMLQLLSSIHQINYHLFM